MSRPPGRDQTAPMERLVRLLGVLTQHPRGAPAELLLRVVDGHDATEDSRRRMLTRDLAQLNALGYDIRNVAETGEEGRYVMRARDNRLQVHLTAEQRGELLRAALAAGLHDVSGHLTSDPGAGQGVASKEPSRGNLDLVQRGVTGHCRIRMDYKGIPRVVHPVRLHSGPSGWYLTAREEGSDVVKEFVVSRMSEVALDAPGTAEVTRDAPRPALDPLSWQVDPPTEAVLAIPGEHRLLAVNLLGPPRGEEEHGATLHLTYVVTNRAVFRRRLYELGTRVHVVGPEELRAELVAELRAFLPEAAAR